MRLNQSQSKEPKQIHFYIVLVATLFLLLFGFFYAVRDITLTRDLVNGGLLSMAINVGLAPNATDVKNYLSFQMDDRNIGCGSLNSENWYDRTSLVQCEIVRSTHQANKYCGWFDLGNTCVGIAVPSYYFNNTEFRLLLFELVKTPCARLHKIPLSKGSVVFYKLSCEKGLRHQKFDVSVTVIEQRWSEFNSFGGLDKNADVVEIYFFDKDEQKFSKRNKFFPIF